MAVDISELERVANVATAHAAYVTKDRARRSGVRDVRRTQDERRPIQELRDSHYPEGPHRGRRGVLWLVPASQGSARRLL